MSFSCMYFTSLAVVKECYLVIIDSLNEQETYIEQWNYTLIKSLKKKFQAEFYSTLWKILKSQSITTTKISLLIYLTATERTIWENKYIAALGLRLIIMVFSVVKYW